MRWHTTAVEGRDSRWRCSARCRALLEDIAAKNGIKEPRDWAKVSTAVIKGWKGGAGALQEHGSVLALLQFGYAEKKEEFTAFSCRKRVPRGYWDILRNRKAFLESFAKEERLQCPGDWARVGVSAVMKRGGSGLLAKCGGLREALEEAFPDMDLGGVAFTSNTDWSQAGARRAFMERLASSKGITDVRGWADVKYEDVLRLGGGGLLRRYATTWEAICDSHPELSETDAVVLQRERVPRGHWHEVETVRAFFDFAALPLGVKEPEDWYRVSWSQLRELKGGALLRHWTLSEALALAYPNVAWDHSAFSAKQKRSSQMRLKTCVSALLLQ